MPDKKIENFPKLDTKIFIVENGDVFRYCYKGLGGFWKSLLALPLACAIVNLEKNLCVIIIAKASTPNTLVHEKAHCAGYWHNDELQKYFDRFRKEDLNGKDN